MSIIDNIRNCDRKLREERYLGALDEDVIAAFGDLAYIAQSACTGPVDGRSFQGRVSAAIVLVDEIGDARSALGWNYFFGRGRTVAGEDLYGAIVLKGDAEIGTGEHDTCLATAIMFALFEAMIADEEARALLG